MTGADAQQGFYYQNYVGVYRLLEKFLSQNKPEYFKFESKGEELEDINIFYNQKAIFEQVKIIKNNVWTVPKIKKILSKFARKYDEICHIKKECIFVFTTNTFYTKDIEDLVEVVEEKKRNPEKNINELKKVNRFFDDDINEKNIEEILKRIKFNWNFFAYESHLEPVKRIKEACINLLSIFQEKKKKEKIEIVTRLYDRICKCSSVPAELNQFTLQDFNNVTGLDVTDEQQRTKIEEMLGKENLEYIYSLKPRLISVRDVYENEAIKYLYLQIQEKRVAIMVFDDYSTEDEINELSDQVSKLKNVKPIIVIKGKKINKKNIPLAFRENIIKFNNFKNEFNLE
ncbi:MAG: hypothetical protein ACTSRR_01395 [Candidatus Heimdallarchaeaceae archaeon]